MDLEAPRTPVQSAVGPQVPAHLRRSVPGSGPLARPELAVPAEREEADNRS